MQCEYEVPEFRAGACDTQICGNSDAVKECADCGKKLCRRHVNNCCDQAFCEFCLELHQTTDLHLPANVKIKTEHVYPPIPIRQFDWCAYDDNTYDGPGSMIGHGRTEHEAIVDFREQLLEA